MSDIGNISYEYARASEFAEKLQIAIKDPIGQARDQLLPLLSALLALLDPLGWEDKDVPRVMEVPTGLARRLRGKELGGRSTEEVLRELILALKEDGSSLGEKELELLEEFLKETKSEISKVSRQMTRR
jgi:hypothetical protein